MNDRNDKTETFEFDRIRDSEVYKKPVERKENDIYSEARKTNYSDNYDEEKSDKKLISVIIGMIAVLIIVAVAGFFIIMGDKNNNLPQEEEMQQQTEQTTDETQTETPPPEVLEEPEVNKYEAVFYSDEIDRKASYYVIKANLVNVSTGEEDLRRIKIDSGTEIRKNGDRIILDAFISLVEEFAGEQIVYQIEVDEEEDYVKSISFSGDFSENEEAIDVENSSENNDSQNTESNDNESSEESQNSETAEDEQQNTQVPSESTPEANEE